MNKIQGAINPSAMQVIQKQGAIIKNELGAFPSFQKLLNNYYGRDAAYNALTQHMGQQKISAEV